VTHILPLYKIQYLQCNSTGTENMLLPAFHKTQYVHCTKFDRNPEEYDTYTAFVQNTICKLKVIRQETSGI